MADIISEEATKPFEDVPNQVTVNSEQLEVQDSSYDDIVLEGLLDVADDAAIWVFGVGGPA
jgi:hypothetical protein